MHGFGALLITISGLSPTIGVFIVGSDTIRRAGTSVFLCFAAAAILGLAMAVVYAELSSAFRALAAIHPRFGSPWIASLMMGAAALAGCFIDPKVLVLILGNGSVAIYAALCLATLVGRKSGATRHGVYRMPLFPVAPVLALTALSAVVWFDLNDAAGLQGLAATAATVGASALYAVFVLRRKTSWVHAAE
jgi:amino acid transporter